MSIKRRMVKKSRVDRVRNVEIRETLRGARKGEKKQIEMERCLGGDRVQRH